MISAYMNDKTEVRLVWLLGGMFIYFLCMFNAPGGDFSFVETQLFWTKVHLLHSFEFPYFTPALCGGFLLGAEPQNTIFTLVQLIYVFVADTSIAYQLGVSVYAMFCAAGTARLLRALGVHLQTSQAIGGLLVVCSGFVVLRSKFGHVGALGIWILPWLMVEAISLSTADYSDTRLFSPVWWSRVVRHAAMVFILINSGHFWPLPVLFLLGPLFVASGWKIFCERGLRELVLAISPVVFGAFLSLAMSALRFAAIFTFAVQAFPRGVGIFGVIGDTRLLIVTMPRSLFDFTVITSHEHSDMLGGFWEWSAYMGLLSLPLGLIGIVSAKPKTKWFYCLLVASVFQFVLTRTTHFGELIRTLVPALREISWFYRDIIVYVFTVSFFVALGVDRLSRGTSLPIAAIISCLLICDFAIVYIVSGTWSPVKEATVDIISMERVFAHKGTNQAKFVYNRIGCYNPILGYTGGSYHSQVVNGLILEEKTKGFYNMNDVRALFSPQGRTGIYSSEPWPLWPVADRNVLDEFLMFKQVNDLPPIFFWIRVASIAGWVGFAVAIVAAGRAYLSKPAIVEAT